MVCTVVILNTEDPVRLMTQYVESKRSEGFEGQEMIPFILRFPESIHTTADLQKIWHLTEAVKAAFGSNRVVSLSESPDYRDTGETLLNDPYITPALLTDHDFDFTKWKDRRGY